MECALRADVGWRSQFEVHRAQQAGLTDFGGGVGRQIDVLAEADCDQRVPALARDVGHRPDVDVVDPDAGVLLHGADVWHLYPDRVSATPRKITALAVPLRYRAHFMNHRREPSSQADRLWDLWTWAWGAAAMGLPPAAARCLRALGHW